MKLTKEEKALLKKIIKNMMDSIGLFRGCYNAKSGNKKFMFGIMDTMQYLAYLVSDEYGEKITDIFEKNMLDSEKKM